MTWVKCPWCGADFDVPCMNRATTAKRSITEQLPKVFTPDPPDKSVVARILGLLTKVLNCRWGEDAARRAASDLQWIRFPFP